MLGDREETSPQENISFGANSMRDGVSLSRQTRQTPLIMPAQLSQLRDLSCYLKLPGDYPCAKLEMKYQKAGAFGMPAFVLRAEEGDELRPGKGLQYNDSEHRTRLQEWGRS